MALDNLSVNLTLEENGVLCHLLLRAFQDGTALKHPTVRSALEADPVAFGKRMRALYEKLADANDRMQGKR